MSVHLPYAAGTLNTDWIDMGKICFYFMSKGVHLLFESFQLVFCCVISASFKNNGMFPSLRENHIVGIYIQMTCITYIVGQRNLLAIDWYTIWLEWLNI